MEWEKYMRDYTLNSWISYKKIEKNNNYHLYDGIHHQHYLVGEKEIAFWEALSKTSSMLELEKIIGTNQNELLLSIHEFESIGLINPVKKRNLLFWNISKAKKNKITLDLEKIVIIIFVLGVIFQINFVDQLNVDLYHVILNSLTNLSILQLTVQSIAIIILSIFFHELGHLLFAINRNILVPTISLQLRKGVISVDTTGMQFMKDTKQIIPIFFAGPFINLILSQYFLLGTILTQSSFFFLGSTINIFFFLQSMCPLFNKTDGQKILTEIFKSNTFAEHMNLFFYLQNRRNLTVQNKIIFDFIWIQKTLFFCSLCLFIYLFPNH